MGKIFIKVCLSSLLFSFFITVANGGELKACGCYETNPVTVDKFLDKGMNIKDLSTQCKKNHFVTGFKQKPVDDPKILGQYIFIEKVTCCKLCL